jgi:hypothetical protein
LKADENDCHFTKLPELRICWSFDRIADDDDSHAPTAIAQHNAHALVCPTTLNPVSPTKTPLKFLLHTSLGTNELCTAILGCLSGRVVLSPEEHSLGRKF